LVAAGALVVGAALGYDGGLAGVGNDVVIVHATFSI
jgi:hypothetical protein